MTPDFEKANEIFFRLGIIYKQQRKSAQSLEVRRSLCTRRRGLIILVLPLHPPKSATTAYRD